MRVSSTPGAAPIQQVAPAAGGKNEGRGTPARLATVVERCANTQKQAHRAEHKHGAWCMAKHLLGAKQEKLAGQGLDRNSAMRQPLPMKDGNRAERYIQQGVAKQNISGLARNDPKFAHDILDSTYASIHSAAKDKFGAACNESGTKMPDGFLREIGEEFNKLEAPWPDNWPKTEFDKNGNEVDLHVDGKLKMRCVQSKDGVISPKAGGTNAFVTPILTPIQKNMSTYYCQPGKGGELRREVESRLGKEITSFATELGLPSPDEFAKTLEKISARWSSARLI